VFIGFKKLFDDDGLIPSSTLIKNVENCAAFADFLPPVIK
jgi:hypothetical protein